MILQVDTSKKTGLESLKLQHIVPSNSESTLCRAPDHSYFHIGVQTGYNLQAWWYSLAMNNRIIFYFYFMQLFYIHFVSYNFS